MMALVSRGILMPQIQAIRAGRPSSAWPLAAASLTPSNQPEPIRTPPWNTLKPVQNPILDQFLSLSLIKNLGLDQLKSDLVNGSESEIAELELERIRPQILSRIQSFTPLELARCVRILALWPCTRKVIRHPNVLNKEDMAILDLRNDLQQECVSRLSGCSNTLESNRYLKDVGNRFQLATSWSIMKTKIKKDTFLYQFVGKHADKSGRSSSFFKRVSKDQLIEFLRLSDIIVPLPDTYHKYYAFYKVIDLFDEMNLNDMVLCLHVLKKKAMLPLTSHPMALELVVLVLEKTFQFVEDLNDDQLLTILIFLQRFAQALKQVDDQFQTVMNALESRDWSSYQRLEVVLRLLFLCSLTPHHRPKIWQETFRNITMSASHLELSDPQNFGLVADVICSENNIFSAEEQMAIFIKFGDAIQEAEVNTASDCSVLVSGTFALLLKGFFHPRLMRSIFTNSMLTAVKSDGSVTISKRYKFASDCPVILNTARILVALSNVVRFDHPTYSGPLLRETEAFVPNIPSQQTSSFHGAPWLDCAQKLTNDLSVFLGGPDYLCENYVLPYVEVPTLVFALDSVTKRPVRIPHEYRDMHFQVSKSVPHDMPGCEWFAVFLLPSKLGSLLVKFQGALDPLVDQHVQRLGYTKLDFKAPKWFLDDDPERNQEIVTEFIQSQISPLVMVSQIENVS